jgi:hypothetical protein
MPDPLPEKVLLRRKLERMSMELASLRSMNRKLLRIGGMNIETAVEEMKRCLESDRQGMPILDPVKYKEVPLREDRPVSEKHKEIAAFAWSDWHMSERVKSEDSNGVNVYSSVVCANRLWELVQTEKKITTIHKSIYPIEEAWVALLGDMVNGSIHEEFKFTNDLSDQAATVLAARLLVMSLSEMKTLEMPIRVDAVVGNHPRSTAKVPTKAQAQTSFDWMVYEMAAQALEKDEQFNFNIHTGQIALVQRYGWRYVLEHGIEWSNGKEEDFEDAIRALFDDPVYRSATGLTGTAFDQVLIGNLHKPAFLERTIKNGALVGQNELGQAWRLKPIKAAQVMWGISKGHVRTWEYQVDVTDVKSEKADNPMSEYAKWFVKKHGR